MKRLIRRRLVSMAVYVYGVPVVFVRIAPLRERLCTAANRLTNHGPRVYKHEKRMLLISGEC